MKFLRVALIVFFVMFALRAEAVLDNIYQPPQLKPVDSELKVKVGDLAPDFTLPCICGENITLSDFRNKKNVMLSFIPAAWTPVCSDQWPGYNIARHFFDDSETIILGISVDSTATLHAWVDAMGGLWFPVLSDFWPHGGLANEMGVLRSDGMAERAVFLIDKQGEIVFIHVEDINRRPPLEMLVNALHNQLAD
ncbi:MAG: peroxiredoxin [Desulfonatronovibrio sp. MSAO_Bac4]|nr:MAG: peroxiredoxin [Desulfonatronovibrio sp. MSAO_Bac4]